MTYVDAQRIYKERHGATVKTCWIADVKRKHGTTDRIAPNRIGNEPKHPCPDSKRPGLEKILRELSMI